MSNSLRLFDMVPDENNNPENPDKYIVEPDEPVLVTGATGFIGRRVMATLLKMGFSRIRCLVRPSSLSPEFFQIIDEFSSGREAVEIFYGNLLSPEACRRASENVSLVYHLAAGTGTKSFSEAFLHSVVGTRNLIESCLAQGRLKRLVNVSSFAVYTNRRRKKGGVLDEDGEVEPEPETRAEAYCYGKVKQDELVMEYGRKASLPYVIVRPGTVYGPGKCFIPGRVGLDTFGLFLHLGGNNPLPLTYVDNCAEAIVLAGLVPGLEGEVFNVVDDNLPTSREFLKQYKRQVENFKSLYLPKPLSFLLFVFWEKFSAWSRGQIPPVYTRREWLAYYRKTRFSNLKLKQKTGWKPRVSPAEGLKNFFDYCRSVKKNS